MKKIVHDFAILFNSLWYRDFPLSKDYKEEGRRAEWTTHIGVCVRTCADLMGLFTHFEDGNRTDAIIKNNRSEDIAHIEWEWKQPCHPRVNEIKKLLDAKNHAVFSVFISYSKFDCHQKNLNSIHSKWKKSKEPLLVILVTYDWTYPNRIFDELQTYLFQNGKIKKIRRQPALPWKANGTRWESACD